MSVLTNSQEEEVAANFLLTEEKLALKMSTILLTLMHSNKRRYLALAGNDGKNCSHISAYLTTSIMEQSWQPRPNR